MQVKRIPKVDQMIMMSTLNAERGLRTTSPLSKPRAVYSIDQILGNHRRNSVNGKFGLRWKMRRVMTESW